MAVTPFPRHLPPIALTPQGVSAPSEDRDRGGTWHGPKAC